MKHLFQNSKFKIQIHRIVIGFVALSVVIGAILNLFFPPTQAAWFDDTYSHRVRFSFTHNANISSPRAVTFTLNTSQLVTANLLQSDCDDLRFTDVNGARLLHDVTGTCNTTSTTIAVIFPSVINGVNVGYVYYGNPAAVNAEIDSTTYTSLTPSGGAPSESSPTSNHQRGPAPILYWAMNESGGTTVNDTYQYGYHGTRSGSSLPQWRTRSECVDGSCLFFTGESAGTGSFLTSTATSGIIPTLTQGTISFWAKATQADAQQAIAFLGRTTDTNQTFLSFYYDNRISGGENLRVLLRQDGTTHWDFTVSASHFNSITETNRWHHYALVHNGTTPSLFIDGRSVPVSFSVTTNLSFWLKSIFTDATHDANAVILGQRYIGGADDLHFRGLVDEFKIHSYAKTALQLQAEYAARSTPKGASAVVGAQDMKRSLSEGLVGYWKFDETSGNAADSSGNNLTLTDASSTTYGAGKFGRGADLELSSADYLYAADTHVLSITGSLTLAAWIRPESVSAGLYNIIAKWDGANESYRLVQNGDELRLELDAGGNYVETTAANLATATWYHVTAVYDAPTQSARVYVNGLLANTTITGTIPASIGDDTGRLHIGAEDSSTTASNYYDGVVDEARIYARALSGWEVEQLYNWSAGPTLWWKLDENAGTSTAADSSTNNFTATLNGSPRWAPGRYGSAILFDGIDDYVSSTAAASSVMLNTQGTISAWVYPIGTPPTAGSWVFDGGGIVGDRGGYVGLFQTNLTATCSGYTGNLLYGYLWDDNQQCVGTTYTPQTWIHLSMTIGDGQLRLYKDGVLQGTTSVGPIYLLSFQMELARLYNDIQYFHGLIDDIRIYNYARTPKQIMEDMNGGHPAVGSPLGSYVGYWKLDEASGTTAYDTSIHSNNLTLSPASWTLDGKYGGAWNGTGSDPYLFRADDDDFDFGAGVDFTLSLWVRSDSATNPGASQFLVDKQVPTNNPGYRLFFNTSGQLVCDLDDDTTSYPEDSVTTTADFYDGGWHHVVCIRDIAQDRLYLYVDGRLQAEDSDLSATGDLSNSDSLTIGAQDTTNGGTDDFAGDIDEVKIYRLALTAQEVLVEYNRGSSLVLGSTGTTSSGTADNSQSREFCIPGDTATCNPPVAWWKMDENTGSSTTQDSSGNNVTGTLVNAPSWVSGKYGAALSFNGSSQAVTATITNPGNTNTLSLWIYPTSSIASRTLITSGRLTTNASSQPTYGSCTGTTIPLNQWSHIVAVSSGASQCFIYQNGVRTASGSTGVSFGTSVNIAASSFSGIIDDVRIYNYARTPAQIAWDYNRGAPVAHYKFDECQGTTAYNSAPSASGLAPGINGTITIGGSGSNTSAGACSSGNAAHAWHNGTTGKYNSSLNVDGTDDRVLVADHPSLESPHITVAAWVYKQTADMENWRSVVSRQRGTGGADVYFLGYDYSILDNYLWGVASSSGDTNVFSTVPSASHVNTWVHIAGTYDGTTARLYLNGQQIGSATGTTGNLPTTESTDHCIGAAENDATSDCNSEYFHGRIDDVRIYNYALTPAQIRTIYNQGAAIRFGPSTGSP